MEKMEIFIKIEKYKHLEKLYDYYSNLQEKTERNLIEEDILNRENENNNREIDVRLKDKEIKEEYLKSVVDDIREKMVQVKEAQEEDFKEKERIRFLGRALHGRLKGLKEINDKIKKKELERKYLIKAAELLIENKLKEQKILEEKLKNLNQQITQNDIINEKLLSVYKDLNKQVNGENGDFYQNIKNRKKIEFKIIKK